MATHSSILAWRIPKDRGAWQATFMGLQRVGHNWSDLAHTKYYKTPQSKTRIKQIASLTCKWNPFPLKKKKCLLTEPLFCLFHWTIKARPETFSRFSEISICQILVGSHRKALWIELDPYPIQSPHLRGETQQDQCAIKACPGSPRDESAACPGLEVELSSLNACQQIPITGGLCCGSRSQERCCLLTVSKGWIWRPAPTGKIVLIIRTGPLDWISGAQSQAICVSPWTKMTSLWDCGVMTSDSQGSRWV